MLGSTLHRARSHETLPAALVAAWLLCLVVFVSLGVYVAARSSPGPDLAIGSAVQRLPSVAGTALDVANFLGGGWPSASITALLALAFLLAGLLPEALLFGLTAVPRLAQALVKEIVAAPRPRPDQLHLQHVISSYSYPSGHVVGACVVWGLAFALAPQLPLDSRGVLALRGLCVVMIVSMGPARIWAGAHWPTDIIGGYLFAALWLIPELWLYGAWRRRRATAGPSSS